MADSGDTASAGRSVRSEVLGTGHVAKPRSDDAWTRKLQSAAESYCWGDIWARPYLTRRDRSLITMAILAAQGRSDELRLHVGGALRNGCDVSEILEVAVHTSVYCGFPTAVQALNTMTDYLGPERMANADDGTQ
jgi:4-carboxymuconolactone decarboxylase